MSVKVKQESDKVTATIVRIESGLAQARNEAEQADLDIGVASLAVQEGDPSARAALAKAHRAYEIAQGSIRDLERALATVRAKNSAALEAEERKQTARRWKKVEELCIQRLECSRRVMAKALDLKNELVALQELGKDLHVASPEVEGNIDLATSLVGQARTLHFFRMWLSKIGWTWAEGNVKPNVFIMSEFDQVIEEGNRWILKMKPNAAPTPSQEEYLL